MSKCVDETLRQVTEAFWFTVGRDTAAAYAAHEDWLYRRVETIEFTGEHSVKRSISVDFEVPKKLPSLRDRAPKGTGLVPISVLHKWPPLMDFDFTGPTGHPTSRYIGATNKQLDFGLLLGIADRALALGESIGERASWDLRQSIARRRCKPEHERLSPALRRELAAVVYSPRPAQSAVEQAVNRLRAALNRRLADALEVERMHDGDELAARIAITVDLAARLAGSSILWVAVEGAPGTDRIVKFSYLDAFGMAEKWWKRGLIACSWRPRTLFVTLPHAGRHVRFHVDIRAPKGGVEPVVVDAMAFPAAPGAEDVTNAKVRSVGDLARSYPRLDLPDEWVGAESGLYFMDYGDPIPLASTQSSPNNDGDDRRGPDAAASAEIVDRRTHVYLGAMSAPSHRVFLQVKHKASRHGFIRGCMIAAVIIAALMVAVYLRLSSVALHLEATVVLLSVVPVVLGYVLVRPGEDALERSHIIGVRLMALISGATPILGALTLVVTHRSAQGNPPDLDLVRPIWLALMTISVLMAVGLVASSFLAASPEEHSDHDAAVGTDAWR